MHKYTEAYSLCKHYNCKVVSFYLFIFSSFLLVSFSIRTLLTYCSLNSFLNSLNDLENSYYIRDCDNSPLGAVPNIIDEEWICNQVS